MGSCTPSMLQLLDSVQKIIFKLFIHPNFFSCPSSSSLSLFDRYFYDFYSPKLSYFRISSLAAPRRPTRCSSCYTHLLSRCKSSKLLNYVVHSFPKCLNCRTSCPQVISPVSLRVNKFIKLSTLRITLMRSYLGILSSWCSF